MQFAPKDCQPTVVDMKKHYQEALKAVAKSKQKKVEELTASEEKEALGLIGLCDLDLQMT